MTMMTYAFLHSRRIAQAGRKKRVLGPLPQPSLPAVRQAILDHLSRSPPAVAGANCPDCAMPSTSLHDRYKRGSTVPLPADAYPRRHVQRAVGATCWPPIWSLDTVLRVLRRGDPAAVPPPARVIGIDDFAWRRGHSYGSIVVDRERRDVIDLLPNRQRDAVIA